MTDEVSEFSESDMEERQRLRSAALAAAGLTEAQVEATRVKIVEQRRPAWRSRRVSQRLKHRREKRT